MHALKKHFLQIQVQIVFLANVLTTMTWNKTLPTDYLRNNLLLTDTYASMCKCMYYKI